MKRGIIFCLILSFLVSLPLEAKKKSLGNGVYWELNDGTLTISGNGKIPDFQECKTPWYTQRYKIKDIIIEEGITSVGRYAFWFIGGESLEVDNIRIPKSMEKVCGDAFGFIHASKLVISDSDAFFKMKCQSSIWCNSLYFGSQEITELVIPNGTNTINQFICYHTKISSVLIPNSVKSIGDYAFSGFAFLENITIPNSVTSIGRSAFYSCKRLRSVVIPNSVISIGRSAFTYCENLISIIIPNSVVSIGESIFWGCERLNSIVIPNSVQTIGESSFRYCRSLTSVVIPTSVNSIGNEAFSGCDILDFVVIPNSLSNIGRGAFPKKTKIYKSELLTLHDNKSDNLFLVNDNGKKGMVRINGKWIIPLDNNYSEIGLLGDKYIKVIQNGNYGLMNLDGKEIIPTSRGYTSISDYDRNKGTFTFTKKGVSGICDAQGREISKIRVESTKQDTSVASLPTSLKSMLDKHYAISSLIVENMNLPFEGDLCINKMGVALVIGDGKGYADELRIYRIADTSNNLKWKITCDNGVGFIQLKTSKSPDKILIIINDGSSSNTYALKNKPSDKPTLKQ